MMFDRTNTNIILFILLVVGINILFSHKPVHIDEANFLTLSKGPWWAPHYIEINWQGTKEKAFDVLSNPPGIAWWLRLGEEQPIFIRRLLMLPWTFIAIWGIWKIARRFTDKARYVVLLTVFSPVFFLANGALLPDMPLMACCFAGLGGLVDEQHKPSRAWMWAFLVGMGFFFRYSSIVFLPLIFIWGIHREGVKTGLVWLIAAITPGLLLCLHDLHAYGQWHFWSMLGFQSVDREIWDFFRKLSSALAMLAGGACLPLFFRSRSCVWGAFIGVILGAVMVALSGFDGWVALWSIGWVAAGSAVVLAGLSETSKEGRWLFLWLLFGLLFLVLLRFVATRYWAPFFLPAVVLGVRQAALWQLRLAVLVSGILSAFLALDDLEMALAQKSLTELASKSRLGLFSGHWGWQYHMEAKGWLPIDDDSVLPNGVWYAVSHVSWPQEPAPGCREKIHEWVVEDRWWGPRVHTIIGRGNFHSYMIAGPVETYVPWSFGNDPHDKVVLWRVCR